MKLLYYPALSLPEAVVLVVWIGSLLELVVEKLELPLVVTVEPKLQDGLLERALVLQKIQVSYILVLDMEVKVPEVAGMVDTIPHMVMVGVEPEEDLVSF